MCSTSVGWRSLTPDTTRALVHAFVSHRLQDYCNSLLKVHFSRLRPVGSECDWWPWKGPVWQNWQESGLLSGPFSTCPLSLTCLSGDVRSRWHSENAIGRRHCRCPFWLHCVRQELAVHSVLLPFSPRLPDSMRHGERFNFQAPACCHNCTAHVASPSSASGLRCTVSTQVPVIVSGS